MKIIVDAFGGEKGPEEIIKGSAAAIEEYGVDIVFCGDKEVIRKIMSENDIDGSHIEINGTESIITMEDEPDSVLKEKGDSSMATGLKMLRDGLGDAFITTGNTGALLMGATMIVKRIKGVKRAALAPLIPNDKGCTMLIDCGANVECKPEYLVQFGLMGSIYMNKMMKIEGPRVGLINNGTEEHKGTDLQIEAYQLFKETKGVNFIGNVEGRDIPFGACDVAVTDGFTGNIVLKTIEGMGLVIINNLKTVFKSGILGMFSAILVKKQLMKMKKKLDYTEYGGAPLLGISKPTFKAHGSSNAKAFKNAIRQAVAFCENDINEVITKEMAKESN